MVINKYDLPRFHIELIELGGEFVKPEHKKIISEIFEGFVVEQYGARECWPIAYSDQMGRLKISKDVYLDIACDDKQNKKNLIITPLRNYSWPLIKYNIGDEGHIYHEDGNAYVSLNAGRNAIYFTLNNKLYNTILFSGLARNLCTKYGNNTIEQFQIKKISEMELNIDLKIANVSYKDMVINEYAFEISKVFGPEIKIIISEKCMIAPDSKTGKYKEFINLLDDM